MPNICKLACNATDAGVPINQVGAKYWELHDNVTTLALGSQPREGLARAWIEKEAHECGKV
jgi:hypothetical protein